ncbi:hypothetical protein HZP47_16340 [Elizabethkingia anophelis]|nr:hypothetical protein [Elizabethkingia anophelis]
MKNNFIKKIDNAIINQILHDDDSVLDSELENMGYDISKIEEFSQKKYKQQAFLLKGYINKQKDLILLQKASEFLHSAIEKNIEKPISYLKNLLQNNQFQVQYRNLDSLTTDEIKEIIKDQNLINLLEDLDNEEK